jgi:hypothetical protein
MSLKFLFYFYKSYILVLIKKAKKGKSGKKAGLFATFASTLHSSNEAHFVKAPRHQVRACL